VIGYIQCTGTDTDDLRCPVPCPHHFRSRRPGRCPTQSLQLRPRRRPSNRPFAAACSSL